MALHCDDQIRLFDETFGNESEMHWMLGGKIEEVSFTVLDYRNDALLC